jgi:hypothetical protein
VTERKGHHNVKDNTTYTVEERPDTVTDWISGWWPSVLVQGVKLTYTRERILVVTGLASLQRHLPSRVAPELPHPNGRN